MAFSADMRKHGTERLARPTRAASTTTPTKPMVPASPRVLLCLSWYSGDIHRGVARYAEKMNWALDLSTIHDSLLPTRWDGDGILCTAGNNAALDRLILSYRKPTVNIGTDDQFPSPRVAADMEKVVKLAVEHFVQRGYEHIGYYICLGSRAELAKLRLFQKAVAVIGKTFHVLDCSRRPVTSRFKQLSSQLRNLPKPLAVNARVDEFAIEVIRAALDSGLRVPEDVAVLGCNDDRLICPFSTVPLSSIDNDLAGIGYQAAVLLGRLIRGEPPPTGAVLIPPRGVTTRQSTDILATTDKDVLRAMAIIKAHFRKPLSAKRVAAELHVSERTLFNSFQRHLGHSVKDEIMRRRMELAAELLVRTDIKTQNVAWESGFSTLSQMTKWFHHVKATTPGAFRLAFRRVGQ